MRYFIRLSYHGRAFFGWQRQKEDITVQQTLEDIFTKVLRQNIEIIGCGRTDTGVHADNYFAHFDCDTPVPSTILMRINRYLPKEIALYDIFPVDDTFHARFDAKRRTYKYFVHFNKNPFLEDRSWWLENKQPDIVLMNQAASLLLQYADFTSFEKKGSNNKHSLCDMYHAAWKEFDGGMVFTITANRFLRNMVRRIVGCLIQIGIRQMEISTMVHSLETKTPLNVKIATPSHGLHLWDVVYEFPTLK